MFSVAINTYCWFKPSLFLIVLLIFLVLGKRFQFCLNYARARLYRIFIVFLEGLSIRSPNDAPPLSLAHNTALLTIHNSPFTHLAFTLTYKYNIFIDSRCSSAVNSYYTSFIKTALTLTSHFYIVLNQ